MEASEEPPSHIRSSIYETQFPEPPKASFYHDLDAQRSVYYNYVYDKLLMHSPQDRMI